MFGRTQLLIMQELVDTELSYIESLQYVVDNYVPEMNRRSLPEPLRGKKNVVFANLEKIHEFHSHCFIRLLRQCINTPFQLGSCFLQHVRLSVIALLCSFRSTQPSILPGLRSKRQKAWKRCRLLYMLQSAPNRKAGV